MHGLEQVLQMPGYHLATAIAVCAALLVLLTCYSLCGTARSDKQAPTSKRRSKPAALPPKKRGQKNNKATVSPKVE
jgi:hypothetical protein